MLCGVTATLGSNPSATATAARPHWGRAVLLCLPDLWARSLGVPVGGGPPASRLRCEPPMLRVVACGAAGVLGAGGPGRPRDRGYRTKRVGFMVTFRLFGAEKSVLKLVGANLKDGQNVLVL